MTGPIPLAPVRRSARVSDADRDRVLTLLREAHVAGRLSTETFAVRVDAVLRARTAGELGAAQADLLTPRADWFTRVAASISATGVRIRDAWDAPRLPRLTLPRDTTRAHVIGRHPRADLVLGDPSVSRWHADLSVDPATGLWRLRDLGSTNGTRVNGWRIDTAVVRPGDRVTFGAVVRVLAEH